jgi:hypothetical protein
MMLAENRANRGQRRNISFGSLRLAEQYDDSDPVAHNVSVNSFSNAPGVRMDMVERSP